MLHPDRPESLVYRVDGDDEVDPGVVEVQWRSSASFVP
jgi:hypothetical protein